MSEDTNLMVQLDVMYPANIGDLKSIYASHIGVLASGEEIFLDACQVQPQTFNAEKKSVVATVAQRTIISHEHARRLIGVLLQVVSQLDEKKK